MAFLTPLFVGTAASTAVGAGLSAGIATTTAATAGLIGAGGAVTVAGLLSSGATLFSAIGNIAAGQAAAAAS